MENRKLSRNTMNKVIGGVCSGLANFFGLDVALVRIAFVIAFMFASFGFWLYIILWIVLPVQGQQTTDNGQQPESESGSGPRSESVSESKTESKIKSIFAGAFIILIGLLFLVNNFIPINWVWKLWPLILVAIGVVMIITASKK
ncbi:MAG: PspC domain-containing protein [Bacteroidales bacterium]|nr:PspC domain-containing protein [Bacteroidales bacterium]